MTLQPQTYYRTRDGRKAFIAGQNPFTPEREFIGWLEAGTRCSWLPDGKACGSNPTPRDLIAVWTDRPDDEPSWEIVDDWEAVVADLDWQHCPDGERWGCVTSQMVGRRIIDCLWLGDTWRWFRRPVPPPAPREWWLIRRPGLSQYYFTSLEKAEQYCIQFQKTDHEIIHVREVIEPKETT